MPDKPRRGSLKRILREAALISLGILACLACVELVFGVLNLWRPPFQVWERGYRIQVARHARLSSAERERARSRAIPTTIGSLPVVSPDARPETDGPVDLSALNRSREVPPIAFALPNDRYTPRQSWRALVTEYGTGRVVFDTTYSTDESGRRTTLNPNPQKRTRFIDLFGCSFVFGTGLADSQTLASQLAAAAPAFMVYNLGYRAGSPLTALSQLRQDDITSISGGAPAYGLFVVIPEHLRRLKPSLYFMRTHRNNPYYEEDADGALVERPSFEAAHPWRFRFYELLEQSQTLRYLRLNFPFLYGDDDVRLMAKLLARLGADWQRLFAKAPFAVVLWPGMGDVGPVLSEYLDLYGVPYLDYGNVPLEKLVHGRATIHPDDPHPSAEADALIARQLAKDLGLDR